VLGVVELSAPALLTMSSPRLIVTPPVNVLLPPNVCVPRPVLMTLMAVPPVPPPRAAV